MLRGGSWNNNPVNVRAANRGNNTPSNRNNNNGFRLAKSTTFACTAAFTDARPGLEFVVVQPLYARIPPQVGIEYALARRDW